MRLAKHLESLHVHGVAHGSVSPACVASDGLLPTDRGVVLDVRKMAANVAFHSPERVRSGQISPQDDAWALACTLYTLLTATMPFQGGSEPEIRDRILAGAAAPLSVYGVDDENLQRIVGGGIAREPSHRYQTLAQMRSDLERWAPSSASLDALEDEGDADEDQAATTMLPMQDAFRAVAALRPPVAAPAPRPAPQAPPSVPRPPMPPAPPPIGAPPMSPPRPVAAPISAPMPSAPIPSAQVAPPPSEDPNSDGLYEEPEFEAEPEKQEQDDTVMRELPAHIMALAARSAAGSTPPPPPPDGPLQNLQVPRPPAAPQVTPHAPMPATPYAPPPPAAGAPPPRPEPSRPAAAALPRPMAAPPGPPPRPAAGGDHSDEDDVRTVYAVHTATELAELERKGPAAPLAAPPPPAGPPAPPLPGPTVGVPVANPVDDDDDDDAVRTVIRDPGPVPPMPPGRPAPPPPAAGRTFKSTQLGMGAITNPHAAAGVPTTAQNAWSPAAAPGGIRPLGGQLAEASALGQPSSAPTPSSGVRLGLPADAPGGADVSALISDALGGPGAGGSFPSPEQQRLDSPSQFNMPGGAEALKRLGVADPFGANEPNAPAGFSPQGPGQGFGGNAFGASAGAPGGFQPGQGFPGGPAGFPPNTGNAPAGHASAGPGAPGQAPGFPGGPGFQPAPFPGGSMGSQGMGGFPDQPGANGFGGPGSGPGAPFGQDPFPGAFGDPNAQGVPSSGGMPPSQGAQIPAHLLAPPGQITPGTSSSMRTWYVVCVLAMMLVAAVTFIALRFMSG